MPTCLPRRRAFTSGPAFDRVLIGYFSDAPDGFLVGAHAASVTERLSFPVGPSTRLAAFLCASHSGQPTRRALPRLATAEAGTVPYMLMADLGAEMIKIEGIVLLLRGSKSSAA